MRRALEMYSARIDEAGESVYVCLCVCVCVCGKNRS